MGVETFQGLLVPGERIVWSGAPRRGLMFMARDIFLVPFSLLWCGFAIFWEWGVSQSDKTPFFFQLWGVPFVLVGLFLVFGRFIVDAWVRSGTRYALTDRRALIMRSAPFSKFLAINLASTPDIEFTPAADGRGTIAFGPQPQMWNGRGNYGAWSPSFDGFKFLQIERAQEVLALVNKATTRAQ
jgi:hypothetical protein